MKRTLFLILVFCILLSACKPRYWSVSSYRDDSSVPSVSSQEESAQATAPSDTGVSRSETIGFPSNDSANTNETLKLDESDKETLSKSAELLTRQLMISFLYDDLQRNPLPYPDKNHISTFMAALLTHSDSEEHPYHGYVSVDNEGYAHFPVDKCQTIAAELFGCDWEPAGDFKWEYREKNHEHVWSIGFGLGSGFECKNIEIMIEGIYVSVAFDMTTSSAFPEVDLLGRFETKYLIHRNENGRLYLSYVETQERPYPQTGDRIAKNPIFSGCENMNIADEESILAGLNVLLDNAAYLMKIQYGNEWDMSADRDKMGITDASSGRLYMPMITDRYQSVLELREDLSHTFTKETIDNNIYLQKMLTEMYKDIDGQIYCCVNMDGVSLLTFWDVSTARIIEANEEKIVIDMCWIDLSDEPNQQKIEMVLENGMWLLNKSYFGSYS